MTADPGGAPPALSALIAAGDWRRAAATAGAQEEPVQVQEALLALRGAQEALRARRYPEVRRWLGEYRAALDDAPHPLLEVLRRSVEPGAALEAVAALEGAQKETDPDTLSARLSGALNLTLTRPEALNMQGILLAMLGRSDDAHAALSAALSVDPGHYRALTNLGNLDMEAGRYAQAEATYREVLRLNPEYDGGHHNLGVAVRRQGRISEGVGHIRRGQRLAMKRSRDDTEAEVKEQFARTPVLKQLRWVVLGVLGVVAVLFLRGGG